MGIHCHDMTQPREQFIRTGTFFKRLRGAADGFGFPLKRGDIVAGPLIFVFPGLLFRFAEVTQYGHDARTQQRERHDDRCCQARVWPDNR